jgi:hypothetical protein
VNKVKKDFSRFAKLRKQLEDLQTHKAQVGLFEDTASRKPGRGQITDNPSLGWEHEIGNPMTNLPPRSFLQMPLQHHMGQVLKFDWLRRIRMNGTKSAVKLLGVLGEETVQEAFATGGFGQWAPLKKETIRRKGGSTRILIDSAQLRKAVSSRVV